MLDIVAFSDGKPVKDVTEETARDFLSGKKMVWVNINGGTQKDFDFVKDAFDIHPLTIEDMKVRQSIPKLDALQDRYVFVVFQRIFYDKQSKTIRLSEIDFCLGKNFLVTVHSDPLDTVDDYRSRLLSGGVKIRSGPDSLMHNIMDMEVDKFTKVVDDLDDEIEELEENLIKGGTGDTLEKLNDHRRQIAGLKKVVVPQRDIINKMARGDVPFIAAVMLFYFKDIYDHMFRFHLNLDSHRELIASAFETYTSVQSNSINKIIKQLTIISTIFLPITFITGVYGMNFRVMPELELSYGYYMAMAIMIIIGVAMWLYFMKRY